MKPLVLNAHAKINLYLRVLRKRKDGYHDIETLFERISLHDEIILSSAGDGKIHLDCLGVGAYRDTPLLSSGPENLCYRAAEQFRKKFGIEEGIRIQLVKKIPIAAGLGGGSSDAATVLSGLNQWWKVEASHQELLDLGGCIGADVPFFLMGKRRTIGKGRGDIFVGAGLKPAPTRIFYLIATPQVSVLTRDVYESWDQLNGLTPLPKNDTMNPLTETEPCSCEAPPKFSVLKGEAEWGNDLEPVVVQKYQRVREFADHVRGLGLSKIRLSGSGPTFFTELQNQEDGDRWAQKIRAVYPNCQVHCVEGY